jgi:hypothetical protein
MGKVKHGILSAHGFLLGLVLDDADDGNMLCPVEIRHRLGERASGFAASTPGNHDVIEGACLGPLLRNEEQMVSRAEQYALDNTRRLLNSAVGAQRDEGVGRTCLASGDIGHDVAEDIEAPKLEPPADARQALVQLRLGRVAGFARLVHQLDGVDDANRFIRHDVRQHVDEQGNQLSVEGVGKIRRGSQAQAISSTPVQANHHVLDHDHLPA